MAETLWFYDDVISHWDDLILSAHIVEHGERVLYQSGTLAEVRRPEELMEAYREELGLAKGDDLPLGTVIFCGALPAIGGIRPSSRFEMALEDPVRAERIEHAVDIKTLPAVC